MAKFKPFSNMIWAGLILFIQFRELYCVLFYIKSRILWLTLICNSSDKGKNINDTYKLHPKIAYIYVLDRYAYDEIVFT